MSFFKSLYYKEIVPKVKSKVTKNILWLSFDKIFKLLLGLIAGIWVARYLGPEKWGKLNYIQAYISILITISVLGMDGFLVKEILESPKRKNYLLGTSFVLRAGTAIVISALTYFVFLYTGLDKEGYIIYSFLLLTVLLTPFDLIDVEYQSKLKSKRTVLAKSIGYICGAALKIILIILKMPLVYFAAVMGVEVLLAYGLLVLQYNLGESSIFNWRYNGKITLELIKKAWPFIVSGLVVILYMRLDQIMLGNMISEEEVGQFSAAVKITELFLFLPMAIASSNLPALMNAKQQNGHAGLLSDLERLFNWVFIIGLVIATGTTIFSKLIVGILFGYQYEEAAKILVIHVWSLIAIFMGVVSSQYLVIEGLQKYSFYRTTIGLATNIILNFLFIPVMKGYGAALATLLSQFTAACFANLIFPETRILFIMQMRSLFFPITILRTIKRSRT